MEKLLMPNSFMNSHWYKSITDINACFLMYHMMSACIRPPFTFGNGTLRVRRTVEFIYAKATASKKKLVIKALGHLKDKKILDKFEIIDDELTFSFTDEFFIDTLQ